MGAKKAQQKVSKVKGKPPPIKTIAWPMVQRAAAFLGGLNVAGSCSCACGGGCPRCIGGAFAQAKLEIGAPNDKCEHEADQVADHVMRMPESRGAKQVRGLRKNDSPPSMIRTIGQPLDERTQTYFESRFGVELNQVRVHTGNWAERAVRLVHAEAFAIGNNIVFRKDKYAPHNHDGRKLLAHELAHVVSPTHTGLRRRVTPDYNRIADALEYGLFDWAITDTNVRSVLNILSRLNATDLADTLVRMRRDGYVGRLLSNISNADLIAFLQQVQRRGARAFAAGQGLATQADMAQAQATFMQARNAAMAAASHGPSPTQAQVSAQQSTQVARTSITPQAATLSPADEITYNRAATAAVSTFVTWVQSNHPALGITASDIRVDSRAVFNRGQNVIAFVHAGKAVVGRPFSRAVNANPAYALAVIVHELRGHPQYGPYGRSGSEYGLEIYDQAASRMAGYTQPTGLGRRAEIDAYAYQETEIYSLMISVPYYTPVSAAHSSLARINFNPSTVISRRIGIIKRQYEARVAQSLLRGLWMRLRLDPRLQPIGLRAFEQGIRNNFTSAESTAILQ